MNTPDKRLSEDELTQALASFDYAHNDVLPAELLQATMNGEAPNVEYNSTTVNRLPKSVTSSMTLDDENTDVIGGDIAKYLKSMGYHRIACLTIRKTKEKLYFHPETGHRINVAQVSEGAVQAQTDQYHTPITDILKDVE